MESSEMQLTASAASPNKHPTSTPYPYPQSGPPEYPRQDKQYPPTTGPPSYDGQQYGYDQPPTGYPPHQGYGYGGPQYTGASPPQQPQQQQQVVVVNSGQQQPVVIQHVDSYVCHIIFACCVFWCCNPLFGLIAFILAVSASCTTVSNSGSARRLGQASVGLSIAGIIVTVIVAIIVVALVVSKVTKHADDIVSSSCPHYYDGSCYEYKTYVSSYGVCIGVKSGDYCYHD